jgi:hypothetical protein
MKNLLLLTPGMISVYESNLTSKTRTVLIYKLFVNSSLFSKISWLSESRLEPQELVFTKLACLTTNFFEIFAELH